LAGKVAVLRRLPRFFSNDMDVSAELGPGHAQPAAKVVRMADPFSPDAFYQSARDFALSALEAHYAGNYRLFCSTLKRPWGTSPRLLWPVLLAS
jgi:hypothetical protein